MPRVQIANGNALILKKACRAVQDGVRFLENGRTSPTPAREEPQVAQFNLPESATMQPQAPQRGSSLGSEEGRDRTAPRAAMMSRTKLTNPASAIRIIGGERGITRSSS